MKALQRGICATLIAVLSGASCAQELTVSAAASLQNAMRDIGQAYERTHPGRTVRFNFAASGTLLAQMSQGAPVDVFASADQETMDKAQAQKLIEVASRVNFAANDLVLVSARSSPASLRRLEDLRNTGVVHIALGNPATVPAGRYAQAALTELGLWAPLRPKLVYAENVRQALNYVSRGEAEAGMVYRTDAMMEPERVRVDLLVPTVQPIVYPMAVVAASANAAAGREFVKFVTGAQGQALLRQRGFGAAP